MARVVVEPVVPGTGGGLVHLQEQRLSTGSGVKAAGVTAELHFHDLRHTGLDGRGQHPGADDEDGAQQLPGRTDLPHMTSDRDRAIADRLGAMIREGGGEEAPG